MSWFSDWLGSWFGASESGEGGGGGTNAQGLRTRRAPCPCCGGGTSGGESITRYFPTQCCPSNPLPETFPLKIRGTAVHDGDYPVTYQASAPALQPLEYLWNYYSSGGEGVWMSDLYQEAEPVSIDCELESPLGCPYTMRITYTFYNVYIVSTACAIAATQFWRVDSELIVPPPGGCPTPPEGSSWSTEGGFPSVGGMEASAPACATFQCSPIHWIFPFAHPTPGTPSNWIYNFALTGCITSTQDYEPFGGCSGATLIEPYAEIDLA